MSKERITIEYIASGQPRPYADSRTIARVQFESTDPLSQSSELQPRYYGIEGAEQRLRSLSLLGKTKWKKDITHGLESHIVYLKPINPKKASEVLKYGDPNAEVSDVWEYYICIPFCD